MKIVHFKLQLPRESSQFVQKKDWKSFELNTPSLEHRTHRKQVGHSTCEHIALLEHTFEIKKNTVRNNGQQNRLTNRLTHEYATSGDKTDLLQFLSPG